METLEVHFTEIRQNPVYVTTHIVINSIVMGNWFFSKTSPEPERKPFFLTGVLPIVTLGILNQKIIRALEKATKRHNNLCTVQRR